LSKVEIESFVKSFTLFFSSLSILITTLFYINYTKDIQTLNETLFSQMRVCSYNLQCEQFTIDFVPKEKQELYFLYNDEKGLSSYYPIPNSDKYFMLINFNARQYTLELKKLQQDALLNFLIILSVVLILSILFSFYALSPLRNALLLTQEFIKDILHDFNTPLASLRLNSAMLKKEIVENQKVQRIEQSVSTILNLEEHLGSYLHSHALQKEQFDLQELLTERIAMLEKNYPAIHFKLGLSNQKLSTNKEALSRIIDNILSNAAKYNKRNGSVSIIYNQENFLLSITDTGVGIKNPKRIFERFYKEQERGLGIGLHIVKKLCEELKIKISVESQMSQGTTFTLNLSKLIYR